MSVAKRSAETILREAAEAHRALPEVAADAQVAAERMVDALGAGGKIIFCGNGGSAADAQHLAAEFLGRFMMERNPLPALALSTNSSTVTAIGNDYGFEQVFARQLRGLAKRGDVLVGISTSGRSQNVVEAFKVAREIGVVTVSLTGQEGSELASLADIAIRAPSPSTPRIQEMHITIGHVMCEIVETAMAGK
ncbi:MAG: D-sedoheptulose 7-phosphate isomerase [Pseudomonadota bacterium]